MGGVAVAAGSDPGWVEDCGCAVPDSARRARRRADSRTVTFSMETVAQRGGDETGSWGKHKMSRAGQATEGSNDYIHGRCARQEPRPHTRLPTRTNPQPSARPTLVPRTGQHSVLGDHVCQGQGQGRDSTPSEVLSSGEAEEFRV